MAAVCPVQRRAEPLRELDLSRVAWIADMSRHADGWRAIRDPERARPPRSQHAAGNV